MTTTQGNEGFVLQNGASGDLTVAVTNNTFTGVNGTNILVGNVVEQRQYRGGAERDRQRQHDDAGRDGR